MRNPATRYSDTVYYLEPADLAIALAHYPDIDVRPCSGVGLCDPMPFTPVIRDNAQIVFFPVGVARKLPKLGVCPEKVAFCVY